MQMIVQGARTGNPVHLRPARQDDAHEIARLFLISSDGLADYIWSRQAGPEMDPTETGAARYARQNTDFSYQNCHVAVSSDRIVGMVHGFAMVAGEVEETDPVLRPYAELEDTGSFFISGVAVDPDHRRQGIGRNLLALAECIAAQRGLPRLSLICFDRNLYALSIYAGLGYRELDRRAIVPHPSLKYDSGNALLLGKSISLEGDLT